MENERKATPRQLAYLRQLMKGKGEDDTGLDESLTFQKASEMIEKLMGGASNQPKQPVRINEPRLGMVLKECYRHFRYYQRDVLGHHREWFKDNVVKTYELFTEIAQELEQDRQMEG